MQFKTLLSAVVLVAASTVALAQGPDKKAGPFGGGGGNGFDDGPNATAGITSITVRSGTYVDNLAVTYGNGTTISHGGRGGDPTTISFAQGERSVVVYGRAGQFVDQIAFVTAMPDGSLRGYGPYGGGGGSSFTMIGRVDAFFGQAGQYLDAVGIYARPDQGLPATRP